VTALDSTKHPRRTRTRFPGVFRSSSGNHEIAYRDSDGKLRFRTTGDNLQAAKAARADIVSKLHRGERVAPTRLRFGEWAEEWIAGRRNSATRPPPDSRH
jgi:hypothetical protein